MFYKNIQTDRHFFITFSKNYSKQSLPQHISHSMIIKNNTIQHPLKVSSSQMRQPFTGYQQNRLHQDTFERTTFNPTFNGQSIDSCKKGRITTTAAYLWAKRASNDAFIQRGHLDELKLLKKRGATILFMTKHYGHSDFPSFIKLLADVSKGPTDFHKFYPHLMRDKDARDPSMKTSVLQKIDKGLGAFLVDTTGRGKGKEALILSLDLLEAGKNIVIFPESGSPLKKKNDPISPKRQEVEPIKNGIAHIIARYLQHTNEGKTDNTQKVYIVPVGISGDKAGENTSSSTFVGTPINVKEELSKIVENKEEYYDKIDALNEVFQERLQEAQTHAYNVWLREDNKAKTNKEEETSDLKPVSKTQIQTFA